MIQSSRPMVGSAASVVLLTATLMVAISEGIAVAGMESSVDPDSSSSNAVNIDPATQDAFSIRDDSSSGEDDEDGGADRESSVPLTVKAEAQFAPCDPDDFDEGEFGGRDSVAVNDIPDPGCQNFTNCSMCLGHRQCGWCGTDAKCVNTRSNSPECANNDNTDVCAAPCDEMWHVQWAPGRQRVVDLFCSRMATRYAFLPSSKLSDGNSRASNDGEFDVNEEQDDDVDEAATGAALEGGR